MISFNKIELKQYNFIVYFILISILYFVFFNHLDSFHIRTWDESMFGVNAYEMSLNNNFVTPYFQNSPDLWNSKPSLLLLIQVFFIKMIGFNELALRLPSAIASAVLALILFYFLQKRFNFLFALSVFFVFVTSNGVSTFHTGRTGDADALLSLWLFLASISLYIYVFENKTNSIIYFFVFLTLSFLTKSMAALLFTPAYLFILIYLKKINSLFKNKCFYIGLVIFLVCSLGYIFLRNKEQNEYLEYFLINDVGRVSKTIESHNEPIDFYFNQLFQYRFIWFLFVFPGIFLMQKRVKEKTVFLITLMSTYLLIISLSVTKLQWYDLPLFPLLSVFSGYTIYYIISKSNFKKEMSYNHIALFFIFIIPLYFSIRNSFKSEINSEEAKYEILTQYAFKNKNNSYLNDKTFITSEFVRPLYCYKYMYNTKGLDFKIENNVNNLSKNKIVIVAEDSIKDLIKKKFQYKLMKSSPAVSEFYIY